MTHAARAAAAVTRDAIAAVARLEASDLLVASAIVTVHGPPHLRPLADRLSALAACLTAEQPESTPEPTESTTEPTGGTP